ncbi:MAG: serpin family protein, partial [Candidatus Cryptobacteroides sp.]|nr:serpin family protein [Candidatus Cryptobacteroides sp.]
MKKIVLIALALAAAVACEKNDGDERHSKRVDITLTKAQESYVEAANNLGLEMLDSKIQSEKNAFIFSPLSTQISLGMLSAGADGETADQ